MDMRNIVEIYTTHALAARFEVAGPPAVQVGDRVVVDDDVHHVCAVEHEFTRVEHITRVTTGDPPSRGVAPRDDVTDFLRYHVLVRVFEGDIRRWLSVARTPADVRFLRALQERIEQNPALMPSIRKVVETSGLWPEEADA